MILGEHPTPEELDAFLRGSRKILRQRLLEITRHLLAGCGACAAHLLVPLGVITSVRSPDKDEVTSFPRGLTAAVQRACKEWRTSAERIRKEREQAAPLIKEILANRRDWKELDDREKSLLNGVPLVDLWIESAKAKRNDEPAEALMIAEAAYVASLTLSMALYGRAFLHDLRALAQLELANAYRFNNNLEMAELHLKQARKRRAYGSGDRRLEARFHEITASLACDSRWFPEAYRRIDQAARIYEELGEGHMVGRALISKSAFAACKSDPEAALRFLEEGSSRIDPECDPELPKTIVHNRILYLTDLGNYKEAQRLLWDARTQNLLPEGAVNQAKLRQGEGRIFCGLGQLDRAERALQSAMDDLLELELPLTAGIAGLDLAGVWLRQGMPEKVLPLARRLAEVFEEQNVRKEAITAMMLVEEACGEERLSLRYVDAVKGYLRKLERNPNTPPLLMAG